VRCLPEFSNRNALDWISNISLASCIHKTDIGQPKCWFNFSLVYTHPTPQNRLRPTNSRTDWTFRWIPFTYIHKTESAWPVNSILNFSVSFTRLHSQNWHWPDNSKVDWTFQWIPLTYNYKTDSGQPIQEKIELSSGFHSCTFTKLIVASKLKSRLNFSVALHSPRVLARIKFKSPKKHVATTMTRRLGEMFLVKCQKQAFYFNKRETKVCCTWTCINKNLFFSFMRAGGACQLKCPG
jgi:hypothetical protein